MILNIVDGKQSEAVQSLQATAGVRWVDVLEGEWDVITIIEASNRTHLARCLVRALESIETITEDLQVLPTCDGSCMESRFSLYNCNHLQSDKLKQARCGHHK